MVANGGSPFLIRSSSSFRIFSSALVFASFTKNGIGIVARLAASSTGAAFANLAPSCSFGSPKWAVGLPM
jgi:hypothetical protein